MKTLNKTILAIAVAMGSCVSANAVTILIDNDFEGSLEDWSATGGTSYYTYGVLPDHNYASGGTGAANLPKSGGGLTLTSGLPLDTQAYTSITISFDYQWMNGTTTRRLNVEYAADGSTFTVLGRLTSGNSGGNESIASGSVTLLEGTDHSVTGMSIQNTGFLPSFTDTAKFRFTDIASAGADVRVYVDNVLITGTPDFIPEPTTFALLGLGGLALVLRRRK